MMLDKVKTMKTVWRLLGRNKGYVLLTIGISILSLLVTLKWNSLLSKIINGLENWSEMDQQYLVSAVIFILLCGGSQFLFTYLSGWTCETITHDMRMAYGRYLLHSNITELENMSLGSEISRLQNEMTEVSNYFNGSFFVLINDLIKFLGTLLWLLCLNPTLTIFSNLPVVGILLYLSYSSRVISETTVKTGDSKMKMNGLSGTLIELFPMIHIFNASNMMKNQYKTSVDQWEANAIKEEKTKASLMSFSALLTCIPLMLLILIGGRLVMSGVISLGTLYIFVNLSGNVSGIMMNMSNAFSSFRRFVANMNRIEGKLYFEK